MKPKATVKLIVPALEARSGPPLAPILGQHQINLMEFCKEFNKLSVLWAPGVPLVTKVLKFEANKFNIKIGSPSMFFLLYQADSFDGKTVAPEHLFDLLRLKSKFLTKDAMVDVHSVLGFLRSKKIKINFGK
jgi:large subunit ribosomal protein L11